MAFTMQFRYSSKLKLVVIVQLWIEKSELFSLKTALRICLYVTRKT